MILIAAVSSVKLLLRGFVVSRGPRTGGNLFVASAGAVTWLVEDSC